MTKQSPFTIALMKERNDKIKDGITNLMDGLRSVPRSFLHLFDFLPMSGQLEHGIKYVWQFHVDEKGNILTFEEDELQAALIEYMGLDPDHIFHMTNLLNGMEIDPEELQRMNGQLAANNLGPSNFKKV
jgi:hypothetical protein